VYAVEKQAEGNQRAEPKQTKSNAKAKQKQANF
jgi:hypothetical protein